MKKSYVIGVLVVALLVIGGYWLLNQKESDNIRFQKEYQEVPVDNVFVYRDINDIIDIMEKGTGVVYLGFPECPWCQSYVKYLNEVAKEVGIEKIYYYNIFVDRLNNTNEYQKIVELLKGNLQFDEEGKERIYVPNVSFHVNGKVIGNDYETSKDTHNLKSPSEYWTKEEVDDLKTNLKTFMDKVYLVLNSCTECNK